MEKNTRKFSFFSPEGKKLRSVIGAESYKVFSQTWREKTKKFFNKMLENAVEIKEKKKFTIELLKQNKNFTEETLKERGEQIRNNLGIIYVFSGIRKRAFLYELIDYEILHLMKVLEDFHNGSSK